MPMDGEDRAMCMSARDPLRAGICGRLIEGTLPEVEAVRRLCLSVRQMRLV